MNPKYKKPPKSSRQIYQFLSTSTVSHDVDQISEPTAKIITSVQDAINSLKRGEDLITCLELFYNELSDVKKRNISVQILVDSDVIPYILPYCSIESQIDILLNALRVANYLSVVDQSENSAFQNFDFIKNLLDLLNPTEPHEIRRLVLNIFYNLLKDETIGNNIFLQLKDHSFLSILFTPEFIAFIDSGIKQITYEDTEYIDYIFSVFTQFIQWLHDEDLPELLCFVPLLLKGLNFCSQFFREEIFESFTIIFQNHQNVQNSIEFNIPENLIKSLQLYHDGTVPYIFDVIYYFCCDGNFDPHFLTKDFFSICQHLLTTSSNKYKPHIIKTLELFIPNFHNLLWESNIIFNLIDMMKTEICSLRTKCAYFLLNFSIFADNMQIIEMSQKGFVDQIAIMLNTFDLKGFVYALDKMKNLVMRNTEVSALITNSVEIHDAVEAMTNDEDEEIAQISEDFMNTVFVENEE